MKILIARSSVNQVIGGAELSARDISWSLIKLGHDVRLATNIKKSTMSSKLPSGTVLHTPEIGSGGGLTEKILRPFTLILQFVWYVQLVQRFSPDVIHPHSRHEQLLMTAIGKIFGKPVIWRDPGDLAPQLTMKLRNPLQKINRRLQLWSLRNADHVIMLNESDYRVIHKLTGLKRQKVSVIGSDILFDDYQLKPNRNKSVFTYGVISRLDKHKGIQYAIEAFVQLDDPSTRLIVAGDGNYRSELEKIAASNPNIKFLGKIEPASEFFNQIDCLIQPSEFEGWGRTVKEAMLFDVPVIGSDVGGIAEQITDNTNGLLFPVGDVGSLVSAMKRVRESKLYKKLVSGGRNTIDTHGDWTNKVERQYIPLFERFL